VTVQKPDELKGAKTDKEYNVPASVVDKLGADLLLQKKHPIGVLWQVMQEYFKASDPEMVFYDREDPIVNTVDNFDKLRLPPGHPGRSPSDTYYVNKDTVLRTHTSAHQCKHMAEYPKVTSFLCAGDVYRRDEIDASHYPVFHQCEGVRLFDATKVSVDEVKEDLKKTLEGLAAHLFNIKIGEKSMRWRDDYFPFTEPSYELDIFYEDDWLEVLGCGVIHHEVLQNAGLDPAKVHGWAFGIGLERIAMVLFGINDIRLFWSDDKRFSDQFDETAFDSKVKFKPFSKYPPVKKDISMWIPDDFVDNDLFEMIRDEGGDQVEKVDLIDEFTNKKTGKKSKAFRVIWRDMSRTLTNEEVNEKHEIVLRRIVDELAVELR
jgi:phenylalanyl-tRNA synthetase alpha chain